jgi:trehalose-6-phosphatase
MLAQHFVRTFLSDLENSHQENRKALSTSIPRFSFEDIKNVYSQSNRRIIFLGDEGTLFAPYLGKKQKSTSQEEENTILILKKLCADPRNSVFIMSSRTRKDLDHYTNIPYLGISYI